MRKVLSLLLAVCMILGMNICVYALEPDQYEFTATVITCRYVEVTDKYAFCAVGDVYGNGGNEPFTFGISKDKIVTSHTYYETLDGELEMGRLITVYFSGEVMESYPMQIVPSFVVVEEETEELTDAEVYKYLSMFYTDEWIIDNGYPIVPECDEDATPPSEFDEEDDGGVALNEIPDDDKLIIDETPTDDNSDWVCGVPLEEDENSYLAEFTSHYLEGFVVASEMLMNDVEDDSPGYASIYLYPYYNFESKAITPVRIDVSEDNVAIIGIDFWEIDSGINLRIYCDYGASCVPVEGERYYKIDGEVLTLEKLEGFTENYNEYAEYFWEVGNTEYEDDSDIDTDDGGFVPDYDTDEYDSAPIDIEIEEKPDDNPANFGDDIKEAPIVEKTNEYGIVAVIAISIAVIAGAVLAGVKLIKKK